MTKTVTTISPAVTVLSFMTDSGIILLALEH